MTSSVSRGTRLLSREQRWISMLICILIIYLEFQLDWSFQRKICRLHYSLSTWCKVVGTEITCGGSGYLTQEIVRGAGTYSEYTKAVILEGIEQLKTQCFLGCAKLSLVDIAASVHTFEFGVFDYCPILNFTFSANVVSISPGIFNNNKKLMYLDVDKENPVYTGVNGMLLTKSLTTLVIIPHGWTTCTIPATVTTISSHCNRWGLLETIDIPDTVTSIGDMAFYASSLRNIRIGKGLERFSASAINSCAKLERIDVDPKNENLYSEDGIFGMQGIRNYTQCDAETSLCYTESVRYKASILFIAKYITELTISSTIESIGTTCFQTAVNLVRVNSENSLFTTPGNQVVLRNNVTLVCCPGGVQNVVIPDSVTSISSSSFNKILSLRSVVFNTNLQTIGDAAFRDCSNLEHIDWNGCSVTFIGIFCFSYTSLPIDLVIPESLKTLSSDTFVSTKITSAVLPSVETIGENGFAICAYLESIELPNIVSISAQAFKSCTSLTTIRFGEIPTLTTLSSTSFAHCTSLKSFTIPATTMEIAPSVFYECFNLTEINADPDSPYYESVDGLLYNKSLDMIVVCPCGTEEACLVETTTYIGSQAFYGCKRLTRLVMANMITDIEAETFYGCINLAEVWLPSSLISIASDAFASCSVLKRVCICSVNDVQYEGNPFPSNPVIYVAPGYMNQTFCGHVVQFLDSSCNIPTASFVQFGTIARYGQIVSLDCFIFHILH